MAQHRIVSTERTRKVTAAWAIERRSSALGSGVSVVMTPATFSTVAAPFLQEVGAYLVSRGWLHCRPAWARQHS